MPSRVATRSTAATTTPTGAEGGAEEGGRATKRLMGALEAADRGLRGLIAHEGRLDVESVHREIGEAAGEARVRRMKKVTDVMGSR